MRILSGMRPTGYLHLGHLHGVLKNWIDLQEKGNECFYFVADLHALTTEYENTGEIQKFSLEIVKDWLSAGIDPEKSVLFVQSTIPQHSELHLFLSMITPLPWLERNPSYKEQLRERSERDLKTYGFLGYPVLQAADILIYKADAVPVGGDQVPHLELTREIARRFNHFYGETFPLPQTILTPSPKIPGTDGRKMSKSYNNAIFLTDPAEEVKRKILTMKTDERRKRRSDPGEPEDCPVYDLHKVYTSQDKRKLIEEGCRTAGIGCIDCKKILLERLLPELNEIQKKRKNFNDDLVRDILREGNKKAKTIADDTLKEVKEKIKLLSVQF